MRNDRDEAIVLRKSGMSYSDIKARLGVPRSTLSSWFHDQKWSEDITRETMMRVQAISRVRFAVLNTVRGGRLKKAYEDARQDAVADYDELKYHPLFIAGVMNYWAHGDKTSKSRVSISSMDPKAVRIAISFLEKVCGAQNIGIRLILRAGVEEPAAQAYWMEKCALKQGYFRKTIRIPSKIKNTKQKHGVCNVSMNSAYLKNKILKWIDLLVEEISQENYVAGMV